MRITSSMQGLSVLLGDRSLVPLVKLVFVICTFLMFGMILNGITTSHELRMSRNEKQTELRIVLIREEYDRKLTEKDETCKQKSAELMNYLKRLAREEQNALQKKMQEQFDIELKNNKNEIENLKLQLKELGVKPRENPDVVNSKEMSDLANKEMSDLANIEKQLIELKAKIDSRKAGKKEEDSEKSRDFDEFDLKQAEHYIADKKLLAELTHKYKDFADEKKNLPNEIMTLSKAN